MKNLNKIYVYTPSACMTVKKTLSRRPIVKLIILTKPTFCSQRLKVSLTTSIKSFSDAKALDSYSGRIDFLY